MRLRAVPPMVIQLRLQLFEQRGVLRSGGFSKKLVSDRHAPDVFREGASIMGKGGLSLSCGSACTWQQGTCQQFPPSLWGSSGAQSIDSASASVR